jgi:hypothetical protein
MANSPKSKSYSRRSIGAVLLVGVLAGVTVGGGVGVIAASSTKPVTVCIDKVDKHLNYSKSGKCKSHQTKLVLNRSGVNGAAGAKGDTGAAGVAGAKGDTGATGAAGAKGDNGAAGTNGATTNSQVKNLCGVNGTTACEVGLQGPGGGIVFMTPSTLGNTSGLFYEAAPSTWSSSSGDPTSVWCDLNNSLLGVEGNVPVSMGGDLPTGAMDGANKTAVMLEWCTSGAAKLADAYTVAVNDVVYGDWFLPSVGELRQMYVNKTEIGGFVSGDYWSSVEYNAAEAVTIDAAAGDLDHDLKSPTMFKVRPVRSF